MALIFGTQKATGGRQRQAHPPPHPPPTVSGEDVIPIVDAGHLEGAELLRPLRFASNLRPTYASCG